MCESVLVDKRDLIYIKRDLPYIKRDLLILAYLREASLRVAASSVSALGGNPSLIIKSTPAATCPLATTQRRNSPTVLCVRICVCRVYVCMHVHVYVYVCISIKYMMCWYTYKHRHIHKHKHIHLHIPTIKHPATQVAHSPAMYKM